MHATAATGDKPSFSSFWASAFKEVLVKAQVRVAFISEGRPQPIPKSIRALMKADLI